MTGPLSTLAVLATAVAVTSGLVQLRRPRARLAGRVRPYAAAALATLGRPVHALPLAGERAPGLRDRLVELLRGGDAPVLAQQLHRSGLYDVPEDRLVGEHRVRQLLAGLLGGAVGLGIAAAAGLSPIAALAVAGGGAASGALRRTAAVDRAVEARSRLLRAEVPALCHLLALRLRANGSVVVAVGHTVRRTRGALAAELAEALAQHRAGRPLDEALEAAAIATPEPEAARVHRLLAAGLRHGLDVAPELLRLAADVRQAHLVRLRREATGRRAAILLPTVGLLAPLILLFIGAPLPGLVLTP